MQDERCIQRRRRRDEQGPVPHTRADQHQRHQHQREDLGSHGHPQANRGAPPATSPSQHNGRQQQADADAVRVRRKGDFLDDQRTPRVEHDVPRRCQAQQQRDGHKIDDDHDQLQGRDAARMQPVAEQENGLRHRSIDGRQFGMVDAVQDSVKHRGNAGIDEKRFRDGAVGCAGRRKAVAVPQVAIEVVFEKRPTDQPTEPEGHGPDDQTTDRKRFATAGKGEVQAEDRQTGP